MFMGQIFLARYGRVIGDSEYAFDEGVKQMTLIVDHCGSIGIVDNYAAYINSPKEVSPYGAYGSFIIGSPRTLNDVLIITP